MIDPVIHAMDLKERKERQPDMIETVITGPWVSQGFACHPRTTADFGIKELARSPREQGLVQRVDDAHSFHGQAVGLKGQDGVCEEEEEDGKHDVAERSQAASE